MILLWATLLVLHQGYTLHPVTTAQLDEPVTLSCAQPSTELTRRVLHWYKQSAGETLTLIVTLRTSIDIAPQYGSQYFQSRFEVKNDNNFCNLTILKTVQEDEGLYHCEITEWLKNPDWSGTYLSLKGSTQKTSNCTSTCGTKVDIEQTASYELIALVIAAVCLIVSVIGNVVLICCRTSRPVCSQFKGIESTTLQPRYDNSSLQVHDFTEGEPELNYAALHFSGKKPARGRKKKELNTEESVYSQVRC